MGCHVKKKIRTMDLVLIVVAISLVAFTICMIHTFNTKGFIPDTLVTCVFATLGGECGVCGWIKTTKERNQQREWQLEDREYEKETNGKI